MVSILESANPAFSWHRLAPRKGILLTRLETVSTMQTHIKKEHKTHTPVVTGNNMRPCAYA